MVKKLMVSVLLAQTVYGADPLLSELKEALLQAKRQKAATDAQLEADSWISPLTLSATAQKTKESGSDVIENKNVGVSWSQDIFRSGGIDALIQKARASGRVELIGIDMEQAGYLKNIYTYWAQARRDALMVKQDTLTLQNREIDLEIIKKQYEVGNKDITDLNRAILDRDTARTTLIAAKNTLQNEILELQKLTGDVEIVAKETPAFPLVGKQEYIARHLELAQYKAQIQSDNAAYDVSKSDYLPKLTLNTSVGYNDYAAKTVGYEGRNYSYGVTMSMPIDYNTQKTLQSSKLQILQSKTASLDRKAELEKVYESALWNIQTYKEKVQIAKGMKQMYQGLYESTKAQALSGIKTGYDTASIENSMKIQTLEIQIQAYNVLIEKIGLYFDIEH